MAYKATLDLFQAMLAAAKGELDGGRLFLFSGPVPATPAEALNTGALHTQLAILTEGNDGSTGLTFDAPVDDVLAKADAETWEGTVVFAGADDGETTLTPTFFRFEASGGNPAEAASVARIQGTVGGPSSAADLRLGSATLTANGSNTVGVSIFTVRLSNLG